MYLNYCAFQNITSCAQRLCVRVYAIETSTRNQRRTEEKKNASVYKIGLRMREQEKAKEGKVPEVNRINLKAKCISHVCVCINNEIRHNKYVHMV